MILSGTEEPEQSMVKDTLVSTRQPIQWSRKPGSGNDAIAFSSVPGHKPIALVGGATEFGDPSGKSAERNLLNEEVLNANLEGQKKQLEKFSILIQGPNSAMIVNNSIGLKNIVFLDFIRDTGNTSASIICLERFCATNRLSSECLHRIYLPIVQGYDFTICGNIPVQLQNGGSDQWEILLQETID